MSRPPAPSLAISCIIRTAAGKLYRMTSFTEDPNTILAVRLCEPFPAARADQMLPHEFEMAAKVARRINPAGCTVLGRPTPLDAVDTAHPFDLSNAADRARLLRETIAYAMASVRDGEDTAGRYRALDALREAVAADYVLVPSSVVKA